MRVRLETYTVVMRCVFVIRVCGRPRRGGFRWKCHLQINRSRLWSRRRLDLDALDGPEAKSQSCCVVCDLRKSGESGPAELGPLGLAERARALNYKPSQ
jgi:hypothetical protein